MLVCAAIGCCAIVTMSALAWKTLDRRPAWVMAVNAVSRADSREGAIRDERAALATAVEVIARHGGPAPAYLSEVESREDDGRTFVATRTALLRTDDELLLIQLYRRLRSLVDTTCSDPQRATRPSDFAFASLLIALLLSWAVFEPSRFAGERPWAAPASQVLIGLALGFLSAAGVLVERGWPGYLLPASFAIAFAPALIWLLRIRRSWISPTSRAVYVVNLVLAGFVALFWLVRFVSL